MLRNTRKRLHEFFRPKNALLQFYLQGDHRGLGARRPDIAHPNGLCAMHFTGQGRAIRKGPEASVVVPLLDRTYTKFHACFTRGNISSGLCG
jgi:hypothetical protein